ncbi:MAG: thioredoxin domain-containing protein [Bacteroidia bacterium]
MKKINGIIGLYLLFITLFINSCSNAQTQNVKTNLSTSEFSEKMKNSSDALVIDVRTPAEFSSGHIDGALNIDWNGSDFNNHIALLEKNKPVMVYCLSGSRSASAASKMRSMGFTEVYEMDGGIMKWNAANFPVTSGTKNKQRGMSTPEFQMLLDTDKLVLVDFYADWCLPCKKMKPYLEEISKEMAGEVDVVRINVDENTSLYKELKIDAIPVLQIYKDKKLIWSNQGFITKEEVVKRLK